MGSKTITQKNLITLGIILIVILAGIYFVFYNKPVEIIKNERINNRQTNQMGNQNTTNQNPQVSELKIETLKEGAGAIARAGDKVTVNYTGMLENGQKFDSSLDRGIPFSFMLGSGQVIAGWEQGILGMKAGEKRKLTIPPSLGYGAQGAGGIIPPNATLIFEVELLRIN